MAGIIMPEVGMGGHGRVQAQPTEFSAWAAGQSEPVPTWVSLSELTIVGYIDLATSTSNKADYTVLAVVGVDSAGRVYILEIIRFRREWPDAYQILKSQILALGLRTVGVETVGFQAASFQELVADPDLRRVAFIEDKAEKDKFTRALLVSSKAANHRLFVRKGAPWVEGLVFEFCNFPSSEKDDQVDAVSGAVKILFSDMMSGKTAAPKAIKKAEGDIRVVRKSRRRRRRR